MAITRTKLGISVLFFASIFLTPNMAAADSIVLKNGDSLTGKIVSGSRKDLVIDTTLAGRVTVKWDSLERVTSMTTFRATLADGRMIDGTLAVADGRVTLQGAGGGATVIELSNLEGFGPSASSGPAWNGALNLGSDFSRGNSETWTLAVYSAATRKGPHDRMGLAGAFQRSVEGVGADAVTTARALRGSARYDHDLRGPLYGFGFGEAANDPLQLLDLRTVVGAGAGMHLVNTGVTQLNAYGGLSYARDSYTDTTTITSGTAGTTVTAGKSGRIITQKSGTPPSVVRTSLSREVVEVLVGQDLYRQLSDTVYLTEALQVSPAVDDFKDYRVTFNLSMSAQLSGWLQWNLSVADRYLQIPPAGGAVQNDLFITTGLGITFGQAKR